MTSTDQEQASSAAARDPGRAKLAAGGRALLRVWLREDLARPAPGRTADPASRSAAARRRPDWGLIAGPAVTLAVMLWGITARPYWGDEMDTVSSVSRSLPQLFRLLGHVDAVHGLYYLVMWPVVRVAGVSELATRLPSALAMAAAAAGVSAIARRLAPGQASWCAGVLFALLPTVTDQGHDARPYAMVTAAAVLASYLLMRAAQDPRPRWFAGYGASLVLVGYMQLFGLLLVPAHAVALIGLARRRAGAGTSRPGGRPRAALALPWLVTVAAAVAAVAPMAVFGWAQRAQISWIPRPGWNAAADLVYTLLAGSWTGVVIGLLSVLGWARGGPLVPAGPREPARLRPRDCSLIWLALPWLLLPPVLLVAAGQFTPAYTSRYLTFCLPAVALLAGAGLGALRWPARAAVLALLVVLVAPAQQSLRVPGGGIRAIAQFLSAHRRPGDAIIYPQPSIPPWYLSYPYGLGQLREIEVAQSPGAAGRINANAVPLPVLLERERRVRRIWVVPARGDWPLAPFLAPGLRLAHEWKVDGSMLLLYTWPG